MVFNKLIILSLIAIINGLFLFFFNNIKHSKIILLIFLVISCYFVLSITLLDRQLLHSRSVKLIPGYSFRHILDYPWTYARIDSLLGNLGNVVMFIPLGMTIVGLTNPKHPFFVCGLAAFISSTSIEVIQYFSKLGSFETDDIIFNTWGAVIGCSIALTVIKKEKSIKSNIKRLLPLIVCVGLIGTVSFVSIIKDYF